MAQYESVTHLSVKNLGCIQDINFALTPLHALIGPNDSGKSTILRIIEKAVTLLSNQVPRDPKAMAENYLMRFADKKDVLIGVDCRNWRYKIERIFIKTLDSPSQILPMPFQITAESPTPNISPDSHLQGARFVRLDPDAMKLPSGLISAEQQITLSDERGGGLAAVYDAIRDRNDEHYRAINEHARSMFDNVERLQLKALSGSGKVLQVKLKSGEEIPAEQMSEGLLYFLGFAALPYLEPTSVLLVEEPENGLHPARIKEIMRVLRKVSEETQVIVATHSPLVINELQPEEVSVVTRTPEAGTRVVCIKDTPSFSERARIYALGELWLSYADGDHEGPLLDPGEP